MTGQSDDLYDPTREGFAPFEIPSDWTPRDKPTPIFVRASDRLFHEVERLIGSGRIDARSELGDAALDYRQERQQMADAMPETCS